MERDSNTEGVRGTFALNKMKRAKVQAVQRAMPNKSEVSDSEEIAIKKDSHVNGYPFFMHIILFNYKAEVLDCILYRFFVDNVTRNTNVTV